MDWLVGFVPWREEYLGVKERVEVPGSYLLGGKRMKAAIEGAFTRIPWSRDKRTQEGDREKLGQYLEFSPRGPDPDRRPD